MLSKEFMKHLEEVYLAGEVVPIRFRADLGNIINMNSKISQLNLEIELPYMVTTNGARIELDRLIEVNHVPAEFFA